MIIPFMERRFFQMLKLKAAAFGFNDKELTEVAKWLAATSGISEDKEGVELDEAMAAAVESALPILKVSQSCAGRTIEDHRRKASQAKPAPKAEEGEEDPLAALKASLASMAAELQSLKASKVQNDREAQVAAAVKDAGLYGQSVLKSFKRMSFDDDADFASWLDEAKTDMEAYGKERTDHGLSSLTRVPTSGNGVKKAGEVMSDEEIKALAHEL